MAHKLTEEERARVIAKLDREIAEALNEIARGEWVDGDWAHRLVTETIERVHRRRSLR